MKSEHSRRWRAIGVRSRVAHELSGLTQRRRDAKAHRGGRNQKGPAKEPRKAGMAHQMWFIVTRCGLYPQLPFLRSALRALAEHPDEGIERRHPRTETSREPFTSLLAELESCTGVFDDRLQNVAHLYLDKHLS